MTIGVGRGDFLGCGFSGPDGAVAGRSSTTLESRRELVLPFLPREINDFSFPPLSPSPEGAGEFDGLDSFRFDEDSFLIGAKASRSRPAGEGLRRAEEGGAPRVADLVRNGLSAEISGSGGTGGTESSVSTSSA